MLSQLRSIFDMIITFQKQQDDFYAAATDELARRERDESVAYEKTLAGQWGMTNADTDERGDSRKSRFHNEVVPKMTVKVQLITKQFQNMVGRFLTMLARSTDPNLRFLSFRIDFNEVRCGMTCACGCASKAGLPVGAVLPHALPLPRPPPSSLRVDRNSSLVVGLVLCWRCGWPRSPLFRRRSQPPAATAALCTVLQEPDSRVPGSVLAVQGQEEATPRSRTVRARQAHL